VVSSGVEQTGQKGVASTARITVRSHVGQFKDWVSTSASLSPVSGFQERDAMRPPEDRWRISAKTWSLVNHTVGVSTRTPPSLLTLTPPCSLGPCAP
jgi:hypothetical protein